jgi:hypothetical protein
MGLSVPGKKFFKITWPPPFLYSEIGLNDRQFLAIVGDGVVILVRVGAMVDGFIEGSSDGVTVEATVDTSLRVAIT